MKDNLNIGCNVTECKYHSQGTNYCTLNKIEVAKNKATADCVECTDCASFMKK